MLRGIYLCWEHISWIMDIICVKLKVTFPLWFVICTHMQASRYCLLFCLCLLSSDYLEFGVFTAIVCGISEWHFHPQRRRNSRRKSGREYLWRSWEKSEKSSFLCPSVHQLGLKSIALSHGRLAVLGSTRHLEKM